MGIASRARDPRGFTLVEVLIAMIVMAIMAMMAWQGVDGIVRTRDASQLRLDQTLRLGSVMSQWEQDLASIQETASTPALSCDGSTLRLTRRAEGGLQVVAWSLRPESSGSAWLRWAGPVVTSSGALQESWLRTQQFQGGEPGQLHALTGLSQWQIYFYQGNAWANCQSSGNLQADGTPAPLYSPPASGPTAASTPGTAPAPLQTVPGPVVRRALPSGVRLILFFADNSGQSGSLVRDVLLTP